VCARVVASDMAKTAVEVRARATEIWDAAHPEGVPWRVGLVSCAHPKPEPPCGHRCCCLCCMLCDVGDVTGFSAIAQPTACLPFLWPGIPLAIAWIRGHVRQDFRIKPSICPAGMLGGGAEDCLVSHCCTPCSLAQLRTELAKRGINRGHYQSYNAKWQQRAVEVEGLAPALEGQNLVAAWGPPGDAGGGG